MKFLRLFVPLAVFCRYCAEMSFETFVEIRRILEAHFVCNLADIHPALKHQFPSNSHALAHDILVWRHACDIPHLAIELGVSHLHESCQPFDIEVRVVEVLCYVAIYILPEILVSHRCYDWCLFGVV